MKLVLGIIAWFIWAGIGVAVLLEFTTRYEPSMLTIPIFGALLGGIIAAPIYVLFRVVRF